MTWITAATNAEQRSCEPCHAGADPDTTRSVRYGLHLIALRAVPAAPAFTIYARFSSAGQHLASVLQEGRESANIDAGLGFIWRMLVEGNLTLTAALPLLNWLTNPSVEDTTEYHDYRPAVNSTGDVVVFERTYIGEGPPTLYQITDFSAPNPVSFLSGNVPPNQTRPDWCWTTGRVAFNGAYQKPSPAKGWEPSTVWQVGSDGVDSQQVPNTEGFYYPTWSLDRSLLVTENQHTQWGPLISLPPRNSIFDLTGEVNPIYIDIDGVDSAGTKLFGGMPTVGPANLPQIAFAGQPQLAGWAGQKGTVYSQDHNYIFLNSVANGAYTSAPMETGASVTTYDPKYQGRAPAWSPDGKTIAFESNRNGGYAIYLCDLASGRITQVTYPSLGGQHAKFFPCGTKLILCIYYPGPAAVFPPEPSNVRAIAWVDISGLLKA